MVSDLRETCPRTTFVDRKRAGILIAKRQRSVFRKRAAPAIKAGRTNYCSPGGGWWSVGRPRSFGGRLSSSGVSRPSLLRSNFRKSLVALSSSQESIVPSWLASNAEISAESDGGAKLPAG